MYDSGPKPGMIDVKWDFPAGIPLLKFHNSRFMTNP